jgi:hypothetical protein
MLIALAAALGRDRIGHAFIELVGAMPGRGVSSVFAFGQAFGIIKSTVATLGISMTFVALRRWKTGLGVPAAKDGARARASRLLPAAAHHSAGQARWPRRSGADHLLRIAPAAGHRRGGVRRANASQQADVKRRSRRLRTGQQRAQAQ